MSIVTKTGDKGQTGLFGGKRISKANARMHAVGSVDELNAFIGMVIAEDPEFREHLHEHLTRVQQVLFRLGADLATPMDSNAQVPRMEEKHVQEVDGWIAGLESRLPVQRTFILPGGSIIAAHLHLARTVCRRAERWIVDLSESEQINPQTVMYTNRLSDFLFLLARAANEVSGTGEQAVTYE